jgi:hypothetical protein
VLPPGREDHDERKDIQVNLQENLVIDVAEQSGYVFPSLTSVLDAETEAGGVNFLASIN